MIYTKKANFPYPILMNFTNDYIDPEFELDVTLKENTDNYILIIEWKQSSRFIKAQLSARAARLILIIKSRDNQFFELENRSRQTLEIPKCMLSVNTRTVMQMMIQTQRDIDFSANDELAPFYNEVKHDLHVKAGKALGFSNTVVFDGTQHKPMELFEKKLDRKIKSDVEIKLGSETILIVYKQNDFQFGDIQNSRELNYPYIYMGLQKALIAFLIHANPENPEEGVMINEMDPPENALDSKLFVLMQSKNVMELNMGNLDEVIYQISDKLMQKYSDAVRGMQNAD